MEWQGKARRQQESGAGEALRGQKRRGGARKGDMNLADEENTGEREGTACPRGAPALLLTRPGFYWIEMSGRPCLNCSA